MRKERKLYYAYLNMFPQSVLDMGKYVDNSDKSENAVLIPRIDYLSDGGCTLSFGERGPARRGLSNDPRKGSRYPLLHHLQFCKYIFTVNNELKLTSVYSAARENAVIGYNALTFSTVIQSGEAVTEALKQTALTNNLFAKIAKNIF